MRWAYLGNFVPPYSTENYLAETIRRRGDTIECFQENDLGAWRDAAARISDFDVCLWTRTPWNPRMPHNLQRLLLAAANRAGVPTVGYHLDRWWGLNRESEVHSEPFFRVDLLCTADGGHDAEYAQAGVTHRWTPPAVAGFHAEPPGQLRDDLAADVGFVGHWQGYHPEWPWRQRLVAWLQSTYGDRARFWSGELSDDDLNDAYVSMKVTVGDSCLAGGAGYYWSNRIPETLARGGLLLHPNVEGLGLHFTPGEHLVTFDLGDLAQLRDLTDSFIGDPDANARIRAAGRAHALAHHTFAVRIAQVVDDLIARGMLPAPSAEPCAGRSGPVTLRLLDSMVEFDLRAGSTDGMVVDEVWLSDAYRVPAEDVAGGLVVDVGANIGSFALWAAAAGAELVVAYEPEPSNAARLRSHVERNAAAVLVEEVAVTGKGGQARISPALPGAEGDAHLVDDHEDGTDVPAVALRAAILGALAINGFREVAVLKIDTEGAEYEMLEDIASVLPLVRRLVLEFHGPFMHKPDERRPSFLVADRFGAMVGHLAEAGSVEVLGRPSVGGYVYWRRYDG